MNASVSIAIFFLVCELFVYNTSDKVKQKVVYLSVAIAVLSVLRFFWSVRPEMGIREISIVPIIYLLTTLLVFALGFKFGYKIMPVVNRVKTYLEPKLDSAIGKITEFQEKRYQKELLQEIENQKIQEEEVKTKLYLLTCDRDKRAYVPIEDLPVSAVSKIFLHAKDKHNRFICRPTSVD